MRRSVVVALCALLCASATQAAEPSEPTPAPAALRVVVSDRLANLPWVIAQEKGWLAPFDFSWQDYVTGLDAFAAGHADACMMTNGDALVIGATAGRASTAILLAGTSLGTDVVVGRPGIRALADLRGRTVGVEYGFASHRLLLRALARLGIAPGEVAFVNAPPSEWEALLAAASVDAVAAWEPGAERLRAAVPGASLLYRSDAKTAAFELLYVSRQSLAERPEDWERLASLWYRSAAFLSAPGNREELLGILAPRLELSPERVNALLDAVKPPATSRPVEDWSGQLMAADRSADAINLAARLYPEPEASRAYHAPSLLVSPLPSDAAPIDTPRPDRSGVVPTEEQ